MHNMPNPSVVALSGTPVPSMPMTWQAAGAWISLQKLGRDIAAPILQISAGDAPVLRYLASTSSVSIPIVQESARDLQNIFEKFPSSEIDSICDRWSYSKVSNTCEIRHVSELLGDRGRCPDLPGTRKRYPGREVLDIPPRLEAKVEAT